MLNMSFLSDSESSVSTSDVGFKHGRVDVDVEVDGVLEERCHSLELCMVSQNLQRENTSNHCRVTAQEYDICSSVFVKGSVSVKCLFPILPAECRGRQSEWARNCGEKSRRGFITLNVSDNLIEELLTLHSVFFWTTLIEEDIFNVLLWNSLFFIFV